MIKIQLTIGKLRDGMVSRKGIKSVRLTGWKYKSKKKAHIRYPWGKELYLSFSPGITGKMVLWRAVLTDNKRHVILNAYRLCKIPA